MNSRQSIDAHKKGRIFIATHMPPSTGGGVERFLNILSKTLIEDDWDVRIVSSTKRNPLYSAVRPLAAWAIGREIKKSLARDDLTICNNYFSWNLPRVNSIVIYHGTEMGRALSTKKVYSRIRNLLVATVNSNLDKRVGRGRTAIAVSKSTKDEVKRHYGIQVNHVIPNAVDTSIFRPTDDKSRFRKKLGLPIDEFLVLFIGADDPRKGSELLRRTIIPSLSKEQHFVMAGRASRPPQGVTALGDVPFKEMNEVYMACDAFIMPSYYEGCSFSNLEALSSGIPSVVSPKGLGRDLMSNEILRKFVVPCEHPERYVDCLRKLQNSADEWRRVSEESRRYAVEFHDIRKFREDYLRVIDDVSSRRFASHGNTSLDE